MKSMDELIEAQENSSKYAKKDQYLKIKDGDSVEGVFLGGVLAFYRVYGEIARYEQKPGPTATYRIGTTFALLPDFTPKAIEMGSKLWNQVKEQIKKNGKNFVYKIRRIGTEKATVYVLDPVRALTEKEVAALGEVTTFEFGYTNLESKPVARGEDTSPETNANVPSMVEDQVDFT